MGNGFPATKALEVLTRDARVVVAGVFTADEGSGRLRTLCRDRGVPVEDASALKQPDAKLRLQSLAPDWLLSANSTLLLPAELLTVPACGALNLHPGRLPDYAGLHVHQWAIRNGEVSFAVTIHHMSASVDTGGIVAERAFEIGPHDTGLSLFTRCIQEGGALLAEVVGQIVEGEPLPDRKQDLARRRLYRHRDALDARVDWRWTARQVVDFARAGNYAPFTSPTYTAALDATPEYMPAPELLVAERVERIEAPGASSQTAGDTRAPGRILGLREGSPLVSCGDGEAVVLSRVRHAGRVFDAGDWQRYLSCLPVPGRLLGRVEPDAVS